MLFWIAFLSCLICLKLSDSEVKEELKKIMKLLDERNINLAVLGEYEPRIIYCFITEELFEHETDDM